MDIDWTIPLSIAVGGFAVLTAAGIASGTTLYIHWRKRKDAHIKQVKDRADAHRTVWYALRQIEAEEKRESEEARRSKSPERVLNMSTIQWLRDYFRDNAALLTQEMHDSYKYALGDDMQLLFDYQEKFGEDMNLPRMIEIAKKEMDAYEQKYIEMGGFDPRKK